MAEHSQNLCVKCSAPAKNFCAKCRNVYYCSREHQKEDWSRHKHDCSSLFQIEESIEEGRYLVARRLIKTGEIILQEQPLVLATKLTTSSPICLGCYLPVTGSYKCSKCSWPLCSVVCEKSGHHSQAECHLVDPELIKLFRPESYYQVYQCIGPLRCLSLSLLDRQRLDRLVSHVENRKGTDIYHLVDRNIVGFIRKALKLSQFQPEEIQRLCGILDTNCFDIRLPGPINIRGLYSTASLMNHDCVANTRHVFEPEHNFRILVIATTDIQPGSKITATYTQSLWNTISRRNHLKSVKHFWCRCSRCSDPREFGTMLSALKCPNCRKGLLLNSNPLEEDAPWKCCNEDCGLISATINAGHTHELIRQQLKQLGANARSDPELLEAFIGKYSSTIHPLSCHVMEAKYALVQLYGNVPNFFYSDLTDKHIANKINYCQQLLELANVIEPGITAFRGELLFEMQAVKEQQAKRTARENSLQYKEMMSEVQRHFQESLEILSQENKWQDVLLKRKAFLDKEIGATTSLRHSQTS